MEQMKGVIQVADKTVEIQSHVVDRPISKEEAVDLATETIDIWMGRPKAEEEDEDGNRQPDGAEEGVATIEVAVDEVGADRIHTSYY